jgi:hypothetical protein
MLYIGTKVNKFDLVVTSERILTTRYGQGMPRQYPVANGLEPVMIRLSTTKTYNGALFLITSALTDRKGLFMDEK